jgi:hypothetical protein
MGNWRGRRFANAVEFGQLDPERRLDLVPSGQGEDDRQESEQRENEPEACVRVAGGVDVRVASASARTLPEIGVLDRSGIE